MNIIFRVLLAFYAFCLTGISLVSMVMTLNNEMFGRTTYYIKENILSNQSLRIMMFIIEVIFFGLSLVFLLSGVKSEKDKKSISKFNNVGEVRIALNTIESIALAASRRLNGVKESKAYVTKLDGSVSIFIKTVVLSDINIPALMEDIQIKVKKSVEDTSGIEVNDVRVSVENIYTGYKSRVE